MVYNPYSSGRAARSTSSTRPSIADEEEEMSAKTAAANRVLQNTQAANIPSPMPTGDAAPTAAAAQRGLVNTGPANTAGIQGYGTGVAARKSGGTIPPAQPQANTDDIIPTTVAGQGLGAIAATATGNDGGFKDPTKTDFANQFGGQLEGTSNVASNYNDIIETMGGLTPENQSFRDKLEETLMGKLDETPEERARREAGRAIAAARAQGGRGQMGMSGGMIGLQSDIATEAVGRAEDRLFDQQMGAGRIGTQLEALDKAERLGLLDYMQTADFESQEDAINFLTNYMNVDRDTAASAAGLIDYGAGETQDTGSSSYGSLEGMIGTGHVYEVDDGFLAINTEMDGVSVPSGFEYDRTENINGAQHHIYINPTTNQAVAVRADRGNQPYQG